MIAPDKTKHFLAGAGMTIGIAFTLKWLEVEPHLAMIFAVLGSMLVSSLKEIIWDLHLGNGTPDAMDFVAGTIGASAAGFVLVGTW